MLTVLLLRCCHVIDRHTPYGFHINIMQLSDLTLSIQHQTFDNECELSKYRKYIYSLIITIECHLRGLLTEIHLLEMCAVQFGFLLLHGSPEGEQPLGDLLVRLPQHVD